MEHRTKVATEVELAELRRLSTEKLIVWIIGKSKELGKKLTPEEVVLECWLVNPDKHALRGFREFPCSRTVLKRVGEMKGKKGLLTGSEISGYGLTDIARRQYADKQARAMLSALVLISRSGFLYMVALPADRPLFCYP